MLNQFFHLLLSDRMTPITNEIGLLDLPFDSALAAYLDWQRPFWQSRGADLAKKRVRDELETILHALEPLQSGVRSRIALIPTENGWTAFFDDLDRGSELLGTMHVLGRRAARQTLTISVTLSEIDGVSRQSTMLDMTQFDRYGPVMDSLRAWITTPIAGPGKSPASSSPSSDPSST